MKIDLLEIFAGSANLSTRAVLRGLSSLEPIDKEINVDLYTAASISSNRCWSTSRDHAMFGTSSNENVNYSWRPQELQDLRDQDRILVDFGCDVTHYQNEHDRLYLGENPLRSGIWITPSVKAVLNLSPENMIAQCDAGAYCAESEKLTWTTSRSSRHVNGPPTPSTSPRSSSRR